MMFGLTRSAIQELAQVHLTEARMDLTEQDLKTREPLSDETIQDLAVDFGLHGDSTFDALGFARAILAAAQEGTKP